MRTKTYYIPFRPEYLLISTEKGTGPLGLTSAAAPSSQDVPAFRFHLSEEAHALVRAQDPDVSVVSGFSSLTIRFAAENNGVAMIAVTRGIVGA